MKPRFVAHLATTDLTNALFCLCVVGYPIFAIAAEMSGLNHQIFTYSYRALVVILSVYIICRSMPRIGENLSRESKSILLFMTMYLVRLSFDFAILQNPLAPRATLFFITTVVIPVIAIIVGTRGAIVDEKLQRMVTVVGIPAIAIAFIIILTRPGVIVNGRASFLALNPISLAQFAAVIILASFVALTRSRSRLETSFLLAASAISSIVIVYANSRGPILSLIVPLVYLTAINWRTAVYLLPSVLTGPIWVVFQQIWLGSLNGRSSEFDGGTTGIFGRMGQFFLALEDASTGGESTPSNGGDQSIGERWVALRDGLEGFVQSPIFGSYFQNPVKGVGLYPHNIVVETGMALGVVGIMVLAVVAFFTLRAAFHLRHSHRLLVALLLQAIVFSMLSGALWGAGTLFLLSAAVVITNRRMRSHALSSG